MESRGAESAGEDGHGGLVGECLLEGGMEGRGEYLEAMI